MALPPPIGEIKLNWQIQLNSCLLLRGFCPPSGKKPTGSRVTSRSPSVQNPENASLTASSQKKPCSAVNLPGLGSEGGRRPVCVRGAASFYLAGGWRRMRAITRDFRNQRRSRPAERATAVGGRRWGGARLRWEWACWQWRVIWQLGREGGGTKWDRGRKSSSENKVVLSPGWRRELWYGDEWVTDPVDAGQSIALQIVHSSVVQSQIQEAVKSHPPPLSLS